MIRLTAITLLALASLPAAAQVSIEELTAVLDGDRVHVAFRLDGAFERPVILRELETGLPTVFSFHVDLVKKRHNWFDKVLESTHLEFAATFNAVTREYLLNFRRDGKLVRSESIRDLTELKRRMTLVELQPLLGKPSGPLRRYRVRVRADIHTDVVFFIIPRSVGADWKTCHIDAAGAVPERED